MAPSYTYVTNPFAALQDFMYSASQLATIDRESCTIWSCQSDSQYREFLRWTLDHNRFGITGVTRQLDGSIQNNFHIQLLPSNSAADPAINIRIRPQGLFTWAEACYTLDQRASELERVRFKQLVTDLEFFAKAGNVPRLILYVMKCAEALDLAKQEAQMKMATSGSELLTMTDFGSWF